jgi:PAS domain S-box-containing protein
MASQMSERHEERIAALLEEHKARLSELLAEEMVQNGQAAANKVLKGPQVLGQPQQVVVLLLKSLRGEAVDAVVESLSRRLYSGGVGPADVGELAKVAQRATARLLREQNMGDADTLTVAGEHIQRVVAKIHEVVDRFVQEEARGAAGLVDKLYESAGEAMLLVDALTRRILRANAAAERMSGYSRGQLRWLFLGDLLPELVQVRWGEILAKADEEESLRVECRLMTRRGEGPLVSIAAGRLNYAGRNLVHLVIQDITEHVRLTQRLADLAGTLQQRVEEQLSELGEQRNFLASILDALPLRVLVLDEEMRIVHANRAFYQERRSKTGDVQGKMLAEVFPRELMEGAGLESAIVSTFRSGESVRWSGYRTATSDHPERIVDIRLDPCLGPGGKPYVLLTIEDVTLREQQLYERTLLQQIMRAMLESGELPRLLYAILTGMTAGGTCGLGFNRAFLLLADEEEGVLRGEMGVGPESPEQAYCIWAQVAERYASIADFMSEYDKSPPDKEGRIAQMVRQMVFPMRDVDRLPMLAVARGEAIHVTNASQDSRVPRELYEILGVEEFVVAPMMVKEKIIGVAIADNFVTQKPIGEDDVVLLTSLANHAALALDGARARERERQQAEKLREAYEALEQAQQELVKSKQLAAIGEVAAIVAHEIRNPLTTIGGFARHLLRRPGDVERVERNARIIREEVERLEEILSDLLELSRPREPVREPTDVCALVTELGEMMRSSPLAEKVNIRIEREQDVPLVLLDPRQFRQVINNVMRNGIEAMPQGGTLTLTVRRHEGGVAIDIADTGIGIAQDRLSSIFDAFVTTKPTGTGLGLALSRAIVRQHNAEMFVKSRESEGTVFTIWFPPDACIEQEPAQTPSAQAGEGHGR